MKFRVKGMCVYQPQHQTWHDFERDEPKLDVELGALSCPECPEHGVQVAVAVELVDDYRDLLKRFIAHVYAEEGTSYVWSSRTPAGFTDAQWAEVRAIEAERTA